MTHGAVGGRTVVPAASAGGDRARSGRRCSARPRPASVPSGAPRAPQRSRGKRRRCWAAAALASAMRHCPSL
eukprot:958328-Alexandrium_andersonii.AAC.1